MAYDRWTPLGRLLQEVNRELQQDAERTQEFETRMAEVKQVLARSDRFQRLEEIVVEETAKVLRRDPASFRVEFSLYDPWNFYRTFQILARDDGLDFQATQAGMGLQSALTVAILRACAEVRGLNAVIAVEEPEIYLHPHSQRNFYGILRMLADTGTQVMYTTHSPSFLSVSHFDEVFVVRREGDPGARQTTVTQVTPAQMLHDFQRRYPNRHVTEESIREHLAKHCSLVHNEGFFATKVILVEGETEELSLPIYARALGFDFDANGVSVIPCNGKAAMPELFRLYNELRIPTYVVFDCDQGKSDAHPEVNRDLLSILGGDVNDYPPTTVAALYTSFQIDYETSVRSEVDDYEQLVEMANMRLGLAPGRGKGIRAKFVAEELVSRGVGTANPALHVPPTIAAVTDGVRNLIWPGSVMAV